MKTKYLTVCIDSNVFISAFAFGGKPAKIIELALEKKFYSVSSMIILKEVKRNLINKLDFSESEVSVFINDIIEISTLYEPMGDVNFIPYKPDSLVLETALLGSADILVTGDKRDLLPLKSFGHVIIEPPSALLVRLGY